VELSKYINQLKSLILSLELSNSEEERSQILKTMKDLSEKISDEIEKNQETTDLIISQLKQENSRLNRI